MKVKDSPKIINSFIEKTKYLKCFKQKFTIYREICFTSMTQLLINEFIPATCNSCPYKKLRFYELLT